MRTPIYLYHVPRTGGTATHKAFQKHPLVKLSGTHERWCPRDGHTITFLRDPVSHANSLYDYIRSVKSHGEHEHAKKCGSFAAWATSKGSTIGNFIKFFSKSVTLEEAIENLKTVGFICCTDRLQADVNLALKAFGIGCKVEIPKFNGTRQKTKLTAEDVAIIKDRRAGDFELYRWVLKHRGL